MLSAFEQLSKDYYALRDEAERKHVAMEQLKAEIARLQKMFDNRNKDVGELVQEIARLREAGANVCDHAELLALDIATDPGYSNLAKAIRKLRAALEEE